MMKQFHFHSLEVLMTCVFFWLVKYAMTTEPQ